MEDSSWGSKTSTLGNCFVISRDCLVNYYYYYFFTLYVGPNMARKNYYNFPNIPYIALETDIVPGEAISKFSLQIQLNNLCCKGFGDILN